MATTARNWRLFRSLYFYVSIIQTGIRASGTTLSQTIAVGRITKNSVSQGLFHLTLLSLVNAFHWTVWWTFPLLSNRGFRALLASSIARVSLAGISNLSRASISWRLASVELRKYEKFWKPESRYESSYFPSFPIDEHQIDLQQLNNYRVLPSFIMPPSLRRSGRRDRLLCKTTCICMYTHRWDIDNHNPVIIHLTAGNPRLTVWRLSRSWHSGNRPRLEEASSNALASLHRKSDRFSRPYYLAYLVNAFPRIPRYETSTNVRASWKFNQTKEQRNRLRIAHLRFTIVSKCNLHPW